MSLCLSRRQNGRNKAMIGSLSIVTNGSRTDRYRREKESDHCLEQIVCTHRNKCLFTMLKTEKCDIARCIARRRSERTHLSLSTIVRFILIASFIYCCFVLSTFNCVIRSKQCYRKRQSYVRISHLIYLVVFDCRCCIDHDWHRIRSNAAADELWFGTIYCSNIYTGTIYRLRYVIGRLFEHLAWLFDIE